MLKKKKNLQGKGIGEGGLDAIVFILWQKKKFSLFFHCSFSFPL